MSDDGTEYVRIVVWAEMSHIAGSTREDIVEFPRAEWAAMTAEQRENALLECAQDHLANTVESGAYVDGADAEMPPASPDKPEEGNSR